LKRRKKLAFEAGPDSDSHDSSGFSVKRIARR